MASLLVAIVFTMAITSLPHPAQAADAKALIKQADKDLRQANRDMFNGKADKAMASLEDINTLIGQAREADPNNYKIKTLENKYNKLVKDLERRTGKDLGGGSKTVQGSTKAKLAPMPTPKAMSTKTKVAAATASVTSVAKPTSGQEAASDGKLPYNARRPFEKATEQLSRIDRNLTRLSDPNYKGSKDQLVSNAQKAVDYARKNLAESKNEAAKKGVDSHPKFDELEAALAEAEKKIAQGKSGHEKVQAQAASKAEEVNADVAVMKAEYDKLQPILRKATGTVIYYNDLKPVTELIVLIENFEANDKAHLEKTLADFSAKYGSTAGEIDKKADALGYVNNYYQASYAYVELNKGIANVKKTRTVMADDLIRRADVMKEKAGKGIHDFFRIKNQKSVREWADAAIRMDGSNQRVKDFGVLVDVWTKEDIAALNAKVDKATWPKQTADTTGGASGLLAAAKKTWESTTARNVKEGHEPRQLIGLVITGSWRVFKKNAFGQPIQWGLPIRWAEIRQSEKDLNLARVYGGSMLTQEHAGVKQAPPFIGAAVGDSYYVRPDKVK